MVFIELVVTNTMETLFTALNFFFVVDNMRSNSLEVIYELRSSWIHNKAFKELVDM